MNPKKYNFKEYETDTVENAVIKYGKDNIYIAVFNMEAKIASLQVEADSLRKMIDWDKDDVLSPDEYAEDIDLQAFAQGRKSSFDSNIKEGVE